MSLALAGVLTSSGLALASPDRVSKGEAQAVFQTRFTGGGAIFTHNGQGAPNEADDQARIKPFPPEGLHYCVQDWHALMLGLSIDEGLIPGLSSVREAAALFAPTVETFVLDGAPLETTRLPVKPFLGDGDPSLKAYVLTQGRVVAPSELAVGSHTFSVTVENDPDPTAPPVYVLTNQFFIDAAGTGACV